MSEQGRRTYDDTPMPTDMHQEAVQKVSNMVDKEALKTYDAHEGPPAMPPPPPSGVLPTVGRMVYLKTSQSPDLETELRDHAAVVADVHSETEVSLWVFSPANLRYVPHVPQGQAHDQWDWMPFQKDQMVRTAPNPMAKPDRA